MDEHKTAINLFQVDLDKLCNHHDIVKENAPLFPVLPFERAGGNCLRHSPPAIRRP